jgi:TolB-like protein/DNA-binding winged helix-turn-helix (wHTH) protein/Flp pilus assembly protein TadD
MSSAEKRFYGFGPYRLDASERTLWCKSRPVSLPPKVIETLILLVTQHGQLVTKDELLKTVWPNTFVSEASLTVNISCLRKLFEEAAKGRPWIETVPRRGYRFVAPVAEQVSENGQQPFAPPAANQGDMVRPTRTRVAWMMAGAAVAILALVGAVVPAIRDHWLLPARQPIHSVAVLPLENLSGDPSQDYLADGLTEALVTYLAQVQTLRVISRTSIMTYKGTKKKLPQIGRELGVDAVIEGSVVRSGDRVQVTAQLIECSTDAHLWAQTYQAGLHDLLTLQNRMAQAIVQQVRAALTPEEKTRLSTVHLVSPESHEAYLLGQYYRNRRTPDSLVRSMEQLESATRLDPDSAEAYAAMGTVYLTQLASDQFPPQEMAAKARAAAEKALALDDSLAEPHAVMAIVLAVRDYDWKQSDLDFQQALALEPNYALAHHWYAFMLASRGRYAEAYPEILKAHELDPVNPGETTAVAFVLYWSRRYPECVRTASQALDLDPNYFFAHMARGECYEQQQRYAEAIADYQEALRVSHSIAAVARLGHAYGIAGREDAARAQLAEMLGRESSLPYLSPWQEALIYLGLGQREQAIKMLEKDHQARGIGELLLRSDPIFEPLRSEPKFETLVRQANLEN